MYSGAGFSDWEIGDVDVFIDEEGVYHLFHLIIPNHDYIAHATSKDGITWKRNKNALFVGHPGEWDDDMLWTMHVSKAKGGGYEMYYTGLQLDDKGKNQKVGRAFSDDLINWDKEDKYQLPLESQGPHYESLEENPREWLSFRDPFKYEHQGDTYVLMCARVNKGPLSRRGCVGLAKLVDNQFELQPPLLVPHVYDDVECPCVFEFKGKHYLVGSIREDIKVRYWFSDSFEGEYSAFHANVLLPQGNYAARIVRKGDHLLVFNFYFIGDSVNVHRALPAPKELDVDSEGRLVLKSFYGWKKKMKKSVVQKDFMQPKKLFENETASFSQDDEKWFVSSKSGYEIFAFEKPSDNIIWEGILKLEGLGKCGLILDSDDEGNGYFISFDYENGFVQIRAWGYNPHDNHNNFVFNSLQTNQFEINDERIVVFKLIRYGSYIELSINGSVKLTLIDSVYSNKLIGIYSSSSLISLSNSVIHSLPDEGEEYAIPHLSDMAPHSTSH